MSQRVPEERTFKTEDGTELFYRYWRAEGVRRGGLALFHRGHEHSGRLAHLVPELNLPDFDFFAWDARGHGRSPGKRGFSPRFGTSVRDVDAFVPPIETAHGLPQEGRAVLAQSVGAVLVATWAHDFAPRVRGLVLASPAFSVKLYVPLARPGLALMAKLGGNFVVKSYVKAKFLTHDPERIASYEADPLVPRHISLEILLGLYDAADRGVAGCGADRIPTQMLVSGADWVVRREPQREFYERLGATRKEYHELPGFFHDTLGEKDRHLAVSKAREFLLTLWSAPPKREPLLSADVSGFTKSEHEALKVPLGALSPKNVGFQITKLSMKTAGRLSDGIRLGLETGFDSGSTLDYVYRNTPHGITPLGTFSDKVYLESIGWRGIRVRKKNLEATFLDVLSRLRAAGRPFRLLDVAAGHGRYVLEALGPKLAEGDRISLRDFSPLNVDGGGKLIASLSLTGKATFEKGDAFDAASLASADPRPTVGVVSGLYELFPENEGVRRSLGGLAKAIEEGGYLVYTNQPWHPQLELIARTLTSHRDGRAWVMRRRTQEEMDDLVAEAGFRKLDERIDEWGIFSVSLAQRIFSPPGRGTTASP